MSLVPTMPEQIAALAEERDELLSRLDSLQSEYSEAVDLLRKSDDANESLQSRLERRTKALEELSDLCTQPGTKWVAEAYTLAREVLSDE